MTIELITGYAGNAHISSEDDGSRNAGTFGSGRYVLDTGAQFACQMTDNYKYNIGTGDAIFDGRHVRVSSSESIQLDNGTSGNNRIDVICIQYTRNTSTGVESCALNVVKGTSTSGTPTQPTIPSGNILDGSATAYMPLWAITITGVSSSATPTKLYGDILPSNAALANTLNTKVFAAAQVGNLPASKITSGTISLDRIPTMDAAHIPSLDASKVGSGTFGVARGGTGKNSHTTNSVLVGNGTSAVKNIVSASGAFYATAANAQPAFGTLPIAQGGTGSTSAASAWTALGGGAIGKKASLAASDIPTLEISKINNLQTTLNGKASTSSVPTALMTDSTGKNGTVSVSNMDNYSHIRVYVSLNGNHTSSDRDECAVDVVRKGSSWALSNDGFWPAIAMHGIDTNNSQLSVARLQVQAGGIYVDYRYYVNFTNGSAPAVGRDTKAYIWRVEGWN